MNISSKRYRDSHYTDKMLIWPFYFYSDNWYTRNDPFFWDSAMDHTNHSAVKQIPTIQQWVLMLDDDVSLSPTGLKVPQHKQIIYDAEYMWIY